MTPDEHSAPRAWVHQCVIGSTETVVCRDEVRAFVGREGHPFNEVVDVLSDELQFSLNTAETGRRGLEPRRRCWTKSPIHFGDLQDPSTEHRG